MSKSIKSILADALAKGAEVKFDYTALNGEKTTRTVVPEEFVSGKSGDALVATDTKDGGHRRFLLGSIENAE